MNERSPETRKVSGGTMVAALKEGPPGLELGTDTSILRDIPLQERCHGETLLELRRIVDHGTFSGRKTASKVAPAVGQILPTSLKGVDSVTSQKRAPFDVLQKRHIMRCSA